MFQTWNLQNCQQIAFPAPMSGKHHASRFAGIKYLVEHSWTELNIADPAWGPLLKYSNPYLVFLSPI